MALVKYRDAQQWHNIDGGRPTADVAQLLAQSNPPVTPFDTILRVRVQGYVSMIPSALLPPNDYVLTGLRFWLMVKWHDSAVLQPPEQPQSTQGIMATEMLEPVSLLSLPGSAQPMYYFKLPETLLTRGMRKGNLASTPPQVITWLFARDQYGALDGGATPPFRFETAGLMTAWWGSTT